MNSISRCYNDDNDATFCLKMSFSIFDIIKNSVISAQQPRLLLQTAEADIRIKTLHLFPYILLVYILQFDI